MVAKITTNSFYHTTHPSVLRSVEMSSIPYQPLVRSRREIRLIVLKDPDGGPNTANSPLKCEMITTSLDLYGVKDESYPIYRVKELRNVLARSFLDDQAYSKHFYAVSYVWGDPAAVCDIEINGIAAKIGASLYAALHSIRKNTKLRALWTDALCINQSDKDEKSWQVQQMAAIYSRARATISWLGPSSEDSKLALETLAELDKTTSRLVWSIADAKEGTRPPRKVKNSALQITSDSSTWSAIANMCARPYWSRIWIFQEMACAQEKYFLCGDCIARGIDRPIALLLAWQITREETPEETHNLLNLPCLSMIDSVRTFRFHEDFPDNAYYVRPGTLHDMLVNLDLLDATEIRDKIYAPLGIATDRDQLGIVPDYSKDLGSIFTETACALIRTGCLAVLVSAGYQDKILQMPSWVPDWSTKMEGLGRFYRADKGHFQRTSTLKDIPPFSDCVTLDGYVVGKITWIHDACPTIALESVNVESDASPGFSDWLNQFEAVITPTNGQEGSDKKPKGGYNTPESAIAELLCAVGGQRPVWSLFTNPYLQVYKALRSAKSLESLLQNLRNDSSSSEDSHLMIYVKQVQKVLKTGSRPYQTDSGAMGLTWTDKDRVGDLVVLIPGASLPCVLRTIDREGISAPSSSSLQPSGHYQLVSVTYIHGIMNGEFFNKYKKKNSQVQLFTLH